MSSLYDDLTRWLNDEITKIIVGDAIPPEDLAPARGSSWVSSLAHVELTRQKLVEHAQSFMANYGIPLVRLCFARSTSRPRDPGFGNGKNQRPKWGQPGRHRRRKARLQARRRNEVAQ